MDSEVDVADANDPVKPGISVSITARQSARYVHFLRKVCFMSIPPAFSRYRAWIAKAFVPQYIGVPGGVFHQVACLFLAMLIFPYLYYKWNV